MRSLSPVSGFCRHNDRQVESVPLNPSGMRPVAGRFSPPGVGSVPVSRCRPGKTVRGRPTSGVLSPLDVGSPPPNRCRPGKTVRGRLTSGVPSPPDAGSPPPNRCRSGKPVRGRPTSGVPSPPGVGSPPPNQCRSGKPVRGRPTSGVPSPPGVGSPPPNQCHPGKPGSRAGGQRGRCAQAGRRRAAQGGRRDVVRRHAITPHRRGVLPCRPQGGRLVGLRHRPCCSIGPADPASSRPIHGAAATATAGCDRSSAILRRQRRQSSLGGRHARHPAVRGARIRPRPHRSTAADRRRRRGAPAPGESGRGRDDAPRRSSGDQPGAYRDGPRAAPADQLCGRRARLRAARIAGERGRTDADRGALPQLAGNQSGSPRSRTRRQEGRVGARVDQPTHADPSRPAPAAAAGAGVRRARRVPRPHRFLLGRPGGVRRGGRPDEIQRAGRPCR